jgi:hypothetical protein
LLDTSAGITCTSFKAFGKIGKKCRCSKINSIGTKANGASGSALIPGGGYMIPMEWNGKNNLAMVASLQNSGTTYNPGY